MDTDTASLSLPTRHFHPEEGEVAGNARAEWDDGESSKGTHESGLADSKAVYIWRLIFRWMETALWTIFGMRLRLWKFAIVLAMIFLDLVCAIIQLGVDSAFISYQPGRLLV